MYDCTVYHKENELNMAKPFYITTDELIDLTLSLQKINDVALPFAVQYSMKLPEKPKLNIWHKQPMKCLI